MDSAKQPQNVKAVKRWEKFHWERVEQNISFIYFVCGSFV